MGGVHDTVEDGIGQPRIVEPFMPAGDRRLAGADAKRDRRAPRTLARSLLSESAGQPGLTDAGGAGNEDIVTVAAAAAAVRRGRGPQAALMPPAIRPGAHRL